ncbi:MAG: recombinase family protein, partial [Gammaproteobacteria bacterium]|nr:recombinase family protein [Gammaproteobacteria bacterium]
MASKILLIARVSDAEQRQALPAQKLRLQSYMQRLGVNDASYFEFDESAYKGARQKFAELIEQVKAEPTEQIVVFDKIDRFTRDASQREVGVMSSLVQKGRIELHFPSDNLIITRDSPATDLFRLGIGMLLAKYYSDASRDNVKRRFEQMWREGLYTHKAPIGYRHTRKYASSAVKPLKGIAVNPKAAAFVLQTFELRSQGSSHQAIANQLGLQGFISPKTGRPYKHSIISKILANKFYIGIMKVGGQEYPHKYPKIVPKELFYRCQAVRQGRQPVRVAYNSKQYTLKGIVNCGLCERTVSTYTTKNNNYLKCANSVCKNPSTAERLALTKIEKALSSLAIPTKVVESLQATLKRKLAERSVVAARDRNLLANIDDRANILYSDRLVGRITAEQHDKHAAKLENERQKLKTRTSFLTSAPSGLEKAVAQMVHVCQNAQNLFQNAAIATKNLMLEILLSNLKLKDKNLTFDLNFPCWGAG